MVAAATVLTGQGSARQAPGKVGRLVGTKPVAQPPRPGEIPLPSPALVALSASHLHVLAVDGAGQPIGLHSDFPRGTWWGEAYQGEAGVELVVKTHMGWFLQVRTVDDTFIQAVLQAGVQPGQQVAPPVEHAPDDPTVDPHTLEELIGDLGLLPWADMIFGLAIPAARLVPVEGETATKGTSRAGGWPDIAAGTPWPASRDKKPLAFVLQVDLAAVTSLGVAAGLPTTGLLSVFHDVRGGDLVLLHAPEGSDLRRVRAPGIKDGVVAPSLPAGGSYASQPLQPVLTLSLPGSLAVDIDMDDPAVTQLLEAVNGPWPLHRIGGYPIELTGDPLAQPSTTLRRLGEPTFAFQLDSNAEAGPVWGDEGIAYVLLDGAANYALEKTRTVVQS